MSKKKEGHKCLYFIVVFKLEGGERLHLRKKFCIFVCTVAALTGTASSFADATTLAEATSMMNQLKQQASQTYSEISSEKSRAASLNESLSSTQSSLQNVQLAIADNQTQTRLVELKIRSLNAEIQANQVQLTNDKNALVGQLRSMYEGGPMQYLNVLFGANSFHDFLSRVTLLEFVAQKQKVLIHQVNQLQASVRHERVSQVSEHAVLVQKAAQMRTFETAQRILEQRDRTMLADVNTQIQGSTRRSVLLESQIQLTQQQITQIEQETTQAEHLMQDKSYVQQQQADLANVSSSSIVSFAETYMGVPYVWGGTSPSGFDCSGFVQYVFTHFGVTLNRTSEEQFAQGVPVSTNDLQPGDLVFFSTYAPGASHVGIYMGNGMMIDAEDRGVSIDSVFNSYWGPKYIGARQVLKS